MGSTGAPAGDAHSVALAAFRALNGKDPAAASQANAWLGTFAASPEAWSVCDRLVREEADDGVLAYLAAQTLRTKVLHHLHQLPPEAQDSLRESLLGELERYGGRPWEAVRVVVTQLSLALVDLYLQNAAWEGFLPALLQRFQASPPKVLLSLLLVFPEETNSTKLRLGKNRRDAVFRELAGLTGDFLAYLGKVWAAEGEDVGSVSLVLSALAAWLLNPWLDSEPLAASPILPALFRILGGDSCPGKIQDSAADCLVQALFLCDDTRRHGVLVRQLKNGVHGLLPAFHMAVAREDSEAVENLSRVFNELAETLLPDMVEGVEGTGAADTLDLVLTSVGYHDYAVAEMSFHVWYRLSELLYQRNDDARNAAFRPYVQRLMVALFRHSALQADHCGTPDEASELSEFRAKLSETVKDVVFLVGSADVVRQMMGLVEGSGGGWEETEAALHVISAVAKNLCPDEEDVVPHLIQALLALPDSTHIAVRHTATRLLSQLWEWLHAHPPVLAAALDWLFRQLAEPKLRRITGETLEMLACAGSREATASLAPFLPKLSDALAALQSQTAPRPAEEEILALLRASARIIAAIPGPETAAHISGLLGSQTEELRSVLASADSVDENGNSQEQSSRTRGRSAGPVKWLDRLSSILRQFEPVWPTSGGEGAPAPPWSGAVQALWPVLRDCLRRHAASQRVAEHCCKAIRFAVRCLGSHSLHFLPSLVEELVGLYRAHPHSCVLYLASILIDGYAALAEAGPGLLAMTEELSERSLALVGASPTGYRDHPDTADDLFRLALRFVQRAPQPFFASPCAPALLSAAALGLKLDHSEAHLSVTKFLAEVVEFVAYLRRKGGAEAAEEAAARLLREAGPELVAAALEGAAFHLSRHSARNVPELLFSLQRLDADSLGGWMAAALHRDVFQGFGVTETQQHCFIAEILQAPEPRAAVPALKDFVRLFR